MTTDRLLFARSLLVSVLEVLEIESEERAKLEVIQPLKRGRGRPRVITDRKAYKAKKAREYRAKKKSGATDAKD